MGDLPTRTLASALVEGSESQISAHKPHRNLDEDPAKSRRSLPPDASVVAVLARLAHARRQTGIGAHRTPIQKGLQFLTDQEKNLMSTEDGPLGTAMVPERRGLGGAAWWGGSRGRKPPCAAGERLTRCGCGAYANS